MLCTNKKPEHLIMAEMAARNIPLLLPPEKKTNLD